MNLPDYLVQDHYGYIHLVGHRIGLRHVVELYNDGLATDQLQDHFPTLPQTLIDKVVAFYLENRAELDAYIEHTRQALQHRAAESQLGPSAAELRQRMEARRPKESA